MHRKNSQSGFTLIELMIVVAIIGLISAIAYPNYVEQVRKSRRADAQIKLQELAQLQESFFSRNLTYARDLSGLLGGSLNTIDSDEAFYQLSVSNASSAAGGGCAGTRASPCAAYTLQAVPNSGTSQTSDTTCALYTLDNLRRRAASDSSSTDTTSQCW